VSYDILPKKELRVDISVPIGLDEFLAEQEILIADTVRQLLCISRCSFKTCLDVGNKKNLSGSGKSESLSIKPFQILKEPFIKEDPHQNNRNIRINWLSTAYFALFSKDFKT